MELISTRKIKGKYQSLDNQKLTGSHYTPSELADFVSNRIIENYQSTSNKEISIFDPAAGDGELLFSLANLLVEKGYKKVLVTGYDLNQDALTLAKQRFLNCDKKIQINFAVKDFTAGNNEPLFNQENEKFDLIIANPPYVRTQSLGTLSTNKLSNDYELNGRIDLYYVFLLGISKYMKSSSVAGYIVSNRFMTTKSGASVRESLLKNYSVKEAWDFGDTKIFEAAVLPAVIVYSIKDKNEIQPITFSSIYRTSNTDAEKKSKDIYSAIASGSGIYKTKNDDFFEVKTGVIEPNKNASDVWRISNVETDDWLNTVSKNTFCSFGEIGKIRVGVKTTADKVFIRKDWKDLDPSMQPEATLLKPLMTHHFARRFREEEGNPRKILYPHVSINGQKTTVDLNKYPKAKKYLESHRAQLEGREYVIEAGRAWYEIWVPHEPHKWVKPKLVFRDICEKPTFWLDESGSIVNGDCYWLTLFDDQSDDLIWVALAVANSTFIEAFYDNKFNNKLYSGRRRFMTQYVEQFPIPKLTESAKSKIVTLAKEIYTAKADTTELENKLDALVWKSFGLNP